MAGIHLAVLWSLAVAQPIFDLLGRNAEFFVARGHGSLDIVLATVALVAVPPALMLALVAAARAASRLAGRVVLLVLVGGLVALLAIYAANRAVDSLPAALAIAIAVAAGGAGALVYARFAPVRLVLNVLAPAPVVFALLFLFASPVGRLVVPSDAEASASADESRTPVAMLVLDELPLMSLLDRHGRIDAERFPNFAALARGSTWYRNAAGVADGTERAVPPIFTGKRAAADDLPIASDHPDNVFSLLRESHRMVVSESVTRLCEDCDRQTDGSLGARLRGLSSDVSIAYLHMVAPKSIRTSLPPVDRGFADFDAQPLDPLDPRTFDNRTDGFERALDRLEPASPGGKPPLFVSHLLLPHDPWRHLPSGEQYAVQGEAIPGLVEDRWSDDEWFTIQAAQRHLLQLGYVDALLGRLLGRLRELGLYDKSLIAVVADHGASFTPGGRRRLATPDNFAEVASVPMFVKSPHQRRGRIDDRGIQTVDLVPTVADELGIDIPFGVDGRPASAGSRDRLAILDRAGRTVTKSLSDFVAMRDADSRRMRSLFGTGDWSSVYAVGPNRDLIGTAAPAADSAPKDAQLDGLDTLLASARGRIAPAYVTGRLTRGERQPLAIGVDGRIAAVTRALPSPSGELRFAAILPPWAIRRPPRSLTVYAIRTTAGGGERLVPLVHEAARPYRLEDGDGGERLVSDGKPLAVSPDAVQGSVDQVSPSDDLLWVGGWAAVLAAGVPADDVVAFSGGRLVGQARPSTPRPDIATAGDNPALEPSGYSLFVPIDSIEGCELRVFAVAGELASEIPASAQALRGVRSHAC